MLTLQLFDRVFPDAAPSPALKRLFDLLVFAVHDRAQSVTFTRQDGKSVLVLYAPEDRGVYEVSSPPFTDFDQVAGYFRQLRVWALQQPGSAFHFFYFENGGEETCGVYIEYGRGYASQDLAVLLSKLVEYEDRRQLQQISGAQRAELGAIDYLVWALLFLVLFLVIGICYWLGIC